MFVNHNSWLITINSSTYPARRLTRFVNLPQNSVNNTCNAYSAVTWCNDAMSRHILVALVSPVRWWLLSCFTTRTEWQWILYNRNIVVRRMRRRLKPNFNALYPPAVLFDITIYDLRRPWFRYSIRLGRSDKNRIAAR